MNNTKIDKNSRLEELIQKGNEVKVQLDQTPIEDEKKFTSLLKRLLTVHEAMNELCH